MTEEEKGFVIKDKRSFDDEGDLKEEKQEEIKEKKVDETAKNSEDSGDKPSSKEKDQGIPLPEVNFNTLIFSLSSSALLNLGEIPDPQSGQTQRDLAIAKHSIDTISMLGDKTKGNLDDEETKFLKSVLADLQWRYVKATKS